MAVHQFSRDRWWDLCLWGLVLLLGVRFVRNTARAAISPSGDFAIYYTASRLLAEGADPGRFYDNAWFDARVRERTPMAGAVNINPPTTDLALLPLAGLDYRRARLVWTLLSVACLTLSVGWLLKQLDFRGRWLAGSIAVVLLYQPLYANLNKGQFYLVLLALLTLAWQASCRQREAILGVTLGAMLVLKLWGGPLWLLLAVQRRWRALAWALLCTIAVVLGSLPWLGLGTWKIYAGVLPAFTAQNWMGNPDFQSQYGFLQHLFVFDARQNPHPLLNAPLLAAILNTLGAVGLLGLSAYRAWRAEAPEEKDRLFAAFVAAGVILAPASLEYHYTLLLLPIAILAAWARQQTEFWPRILLAIAIALVVLKLPSLSSRLTGGLWSLLAYPRLYGAYLLWALGAARLAPGVKALRADVG